MALFCLIDSFDENMRLDYSYYKNNYRCLLNEMYNEYNAKCGNKRASNLDTNFENLSSSFKNKSKAHLVNMIRRKFASGASSSSSTSTSSLHKLNIF